MWCKQIILYSSFFGCGTQADTLLLVLAVGLPPPYRVAHSRQAGHTTLFSTILWASPSQGTGLAGCHFAKLARGYAPEMGPSCLWLPPGTLGLPIPSGTRWLSPRAFFLCCDSGVHQTLQSSYLATYSTLSLLPLIVTAMSDTNSLSPCPMVYKGTLCALPVSLPTPASLGGLSAIPYGFHFFCLSAPSGILLLYVYFSSSSPQMFWVACLIRTAGLSSGTRLAGPNSTCETIYMLLVLVGFSLFLLRVKTGRLADCLDD